MAVITSSSLRLGSPDCAGADLGELYARLAGRLLRIVRADVRAPEAVIEDACQTAWVRLIAHRQGVQREAALGWLATTAVREALRLIRREAREPSLQATLEAGGDGSAPCLAGRTPTLEDQVQQRQRLAAVSELPERQERMVWLHAAGLSYREIAAITGDTPRTVERQLLRAKRRLREIDHAG